MTANLSVLSNGLTARTDPECGRERARNLAILGARTVLELCVGPSLESLERAYGANGMSVTGNDIDPRWEEHYPTGRWLIGDAMDIDPSGFDAVVFAPPLSRGCTGRREDALRVSEVSPPYAGFIDRMMGLGFTGIGVLVLPARCLATRRDRRETHHTLALLGDSWQEAVELRAGARRIRKYVDVYFRIPSRSMKSTTSAVTRANSSALSSSASPPSSQDFGPPSEM